MAATRLIALHLNKGKTLAQCLKDRTDYVQDPEKTEQGELVTAYGCSPLTADEEFLLSKRQYHQITGRRQEKEVIAYQIRQSFKPGEVTPEQANQIGQELAQRFTKGKHAFLVATHTDRAHVHNHIIFNSTSLDCEHKFNNFFFSGLAVQRLSDLICLEHGLSVIEPKPYSERQKRTEYPKKASLRDGLRETLDVILRSDPRPHTMEELLSALQKQGYEIKRGKHLSVRGKGQKRFIRLDSLGEGYTEAALRSILESDASYTPPPRETKRSAPAKPAGHPHSQQSFQLLIDIQAKLADGSLRSQRSADLYNLKQISKTLLFLRDEKIGSIEELDARAKAATREFNALSDSIKASEQRLAEIAVLKKHIINYSKTREVYVAYRKAGYSKKFFEAHREELTLHKAAKAAFDELGVKTLPKVKDLNAEYAQVLAEKKKAYAGYHAAKQRMQEYRKAQKNVELFLADEKALTADRPSQEFLSRSR